MKRYIKGGPSMPQKDDSPLKRKKALTHTLQCGWTLKRNLKKIFFSAVPHGRWDFSSLTRDWIPTPCIGRWNPNHWTPREVPGWTLKTLCSNKPDTKRPQSVWFHLLKQEVSRTDKSPETENECSGGWGRGKGGLRGTGKGCKTSLVVVQSLSCVWLFATP